ncbi:hypothetical protein HPB47_000868 [Ixodes persulcatus]|uniref:Uncharacterized protein n=1 Tax=Ixodes persulcatus TaxID=34615 RepID=A0AC60PS37_IXOPE|nr:hypothetical protein HPB47_000868 [Ixodes persulcatus]
MSQLGDLTSSDKRRMAASALAESLSEAWRQIRFFKDCIHDACHREATFDQATRRVQRELQTASRITEVQWRQILATLPKKRDCRSPEGQAVHVIGNTDVPDKARRVLCLGPKFCNQPELSKPELLSMVRSTAARADVETVEGVIRDGVDCLRRSSKGISSIRTEDTICALREANLKLLLSDKEGGFAIVPDDIYNQKAAEAITSNFTLLKNYKPEKTKKEAVKLCERLNLTKLASSVRSGKGLSLEAFFSAKTHKMACPFRVIVSERGTWQRLLGHYLQKSLSVLEVEDPYLVRTPSMESDYLHQLPKGKVLAFSVDIKDLYYSLPHDSICETVIDGIDRHGPLKFQNTVGITAEDFVNLLMLYLRSTTVVFRTTLNHGYAPACVQDLASYNAPKYDPNEDRALDQGPVHQNTIGRNFPRTRIHFPEVWKSADRRMFSSQNYARTIALIGSWSKETKSGTRSRCCTGQKGRHSPHFTGLI